jgi:hypothetical protein
VLDWMDEQSLTLSRCRQENEVDYQNNLRSWPIKRGGSLFIDSFIGVIVKCFR